MFHPGNIILDKFRLNQQLGIGGFSETWKAKDIETGLEVAIKFFLKQDRATLILCEEEYLRMVSLNHPNILQPILFSSYKDTPLIVLSYCDGGSAHTLKGNCTEIQVASLISQIGSVLNYLHQKKKIVHNDLTPDNILCKTNGTFLLADFGISEQINGKLSEYSTTAKWGPAGLTPSAYRAPECSGLQFPAAAHDIWSFGATIYQIASGQLPFGTAGGMQELAYFNNNPGLHMDDILPRLPEQFSEELDYLLKRCMHPNPSERPTAHELKTSANQYLRNRKKWGINHAQMKQSVCIYSIICVTIIILTLIIYMAASRCVQKITF